MPAASWGRIESLKLIQGMKFHQRSIQQTNCLSNHLSIVSTVSLTQLILLTQFKLKVNVVSLSLDGSVDESSSVALQIQNGILSFQQALSHMLRRASPNQRNDSRKQCQKHGKWNQQWPPWLVCTVVRKLFSCIALLRFQSRIKWHQISAARNHRQNCCKKKLENGARAMARPGKGLLRNCRILSHHGILRSLDILRNYGIFRDHVIFKGHVILINIIWDRGHVIHRHVVIGCVVVVWRLVVVCCSCKLIPAFRSLSCCLLLGGGIARIKSEFDRTMSDSIG